MCGICVLPCATETIFSYALCQLFPWFHVHISMQIILCSNASYTQENVRDTETERDRDSEEDELTYYGSGDTETASDVMSAPATTSKYLQSDLVYSRDTLSSVGVPHLFLDPLVFLLHSLFRSMRVRKVWLFY